MDLYSSFSLNYLRPIFTTTQITALLPLLYSLTLEHILKCLKEPLSSFRANPTSVVILSIKLLSSEATEIDKKTFTEQELLEGLDAYTAHADELAELVDEEVDMDDIE